VLTHSNPYNESLNYYKEFWRFYMLNEVYIKTINDLSNYNKKLAELTEELGVVINIYIQSRTSNVSLQNPYLKEPKRKTDVLPRRLKNHLLVPTNNVTKFMEVMFL